MSQNGRFEAAKPPSDAMAPSHLYAFCDSSMSDSYSRFQAQTRFSSLDGLRALSILGVIWHHTAASVHGPFWGHVGAEGVSLFFAISGFLITTLLLRERRRQGHIDLKAFYVRRTLRIFPLYYATLLLYVIMVLALERHSAVGRAFFDHLPYFATYTSNLFVEIQGRVIFYFAWSLAAEEQFYLIWPGLMLLAGSRPRSALLLALWLGISQWAQSSGHGVWAFMPSPLLAGALLALLLDQPRSHAALSRVLGLPGAPLVAALALCAALAWGQAPSLLLGVLFATWVGTCVIREQHVLQPLLNWRPLAYLGTVSYGMYMLHMLCKNAVIKMLGLFGPVADGGLVFGLTLMLALLAASVSFRYFESWFLQRKRAYER